MRTRLSRLRGALRMYRYFVHRDYAERSNAWLFRRNYVTRPALRAEMDKWWTLAESIRREAR